MDLGLKGKMALVTGGSKGLGKAIAEELAREGANISICARGKQDLDAVAEALHGYGARVAAISADVTRADDAERVIEQTVKQLGGIDILVNNAGDAWLSHMLDTTDEEWRYCLEVNLMSRFGSRAGLGRTCVSRAAVASSTFRPWAQRRRSR